KLLYCTYLGGEANDGGIGIELDPDGNIFLSGFTASERFPVSSDAMQRTYGGGNADLLGYVSIGDAFLMKLDPSFKLVYSTYLGGSHDDYSTSLSLDDSGNGYLTGTTASSNFPVAGGFSPRNLPSAGSTKFNDAFVAKFSGFAAASTFAISAVQNAASYADVV